MNKFKKAIENNELLEFATGENDYYVVDKQYDEHSILLSWKNYIIKYIDKVGTEKANAAIESMFKKLLNTSSISSDEKYDALLYHLHVYYYLRKEKDITGNDALESIEPEISKGLKAYVESVKGRNDKSYFTDSIETIIKNGGLQDYVKKKNKDQKGAIFSESNNFSLFTDNENFIINVFFSSNENNNIKSYRLLESEVPEDYSRLAPLAQDIRENPRFYEDRLVSKDEEE